MTTEVSLEIMLYIHRHNVHVNHTCAFLAFEFSHFVDAKMLFAKLKYVALFNLHRTIGRSTTPNAMYVVRRLCAKLVISSFSMRILACSSYLS